MEWTSVVLYRGALSFYKVFSVRDRTFMANLIRYTGDPASSPPNALRLYKEGRRWRTDSKEEDLVEDIGLSIEEGIRGGLL